MKIETPNLIIMLLLTICATLLVKSQVESKHQPQVQAATPAGSGQTETSISADSSGASNPSTIDIIMRRKSVRDYTDKPVDKQTLDILIKAGMAAPTAGNKQPWEFVAITDRNTLDALADKLEYAKMLKKAPAAIVVCGVPKLSFPGTESEYWIQDCSAVTENILLAVESLNLGAVWASVYPGKDRIDSVRSILNLPDDIIPLNIIAIGYPTGKEKPKNKYKPERIHWEKW